MADIALTRAAQVDVVESIEQATLPCGEAITPGAPVRIDATGNFVNAAGGTAPNADGYGVAVGDRIVPAGMPITAIRKGVVAGFGLGAVAFNARIYVSNTAGRLSDTEGTVSVAVGRVIPGRGQLLGATPHKLIAVDMP